MAANNHDIEIERKFLLRGTWPVAQTIQSIRQIYINPGAAVSVRLRDCDGHFSLTLKKGRSAVVRSEYNLPVETAQGARMMAEFATGGAIEKQRHLIPMADITWEVDVFTGANAGLIIAEVELQHEAQAFSKPDWLGREISTDPRFTNHALFLNPFSRWGVSYQDILTGQ
jgi:adenylate cyclase